MRLSISIVSHGHGAILAAALDDIVRHAPASSEIIVTINTPEAPGFDRSRWPGVMWIDNAVPQGFGHNHNAALAGRKTEWFAIVNPDIRLSSDIFSPLMAAGDADHTTGLVVPVIRDSAGATQDSARALPTPWLIARRMLVRIAGRTNPPDARRDHAWYAGMFMVVRRGAFQAVGGFDDRFFLYCEDVDLCVRLSLAGFGLVMRDEVSAIHDAQRDSLAKSRHLRWHVASLGRLWLSADFWRYWYRTTRQPGVIST